MGVGIGKGKCNGDREWKGERSWGGVGSGKGKGYGGRDWKGEM